MQQFWYSIKKLQGTDSYEFLLAKKKCIVNAEVFRTIIDIRPRVEGVDFTDVPDNDTALTLLIDLGYKGPLYENTNMFMDHMHQPWRTLAAIINKCFSGKTTNSHQEEQRQRFIRKKTANDSQKTIDVFEESKPEPEPVKKKTSSKRRVKKKVTLSADDNIIFDDPDAALELSISKTEAEEARQAHATHARIMTESVLEYAKKKSGGRSSKNIMQALKESKKTSRRKPGTRGSNKGTGSKPVVPDKSTFIFATSSEGTSINLRVPDEKNDITKEKVILGDEHDSEYSDNDNYDVEKDDKDGDVDDEGNDHISDTQDADESALDLRTSVVMVGASVVIVGVGIGVVC
nr:hypothetical protein [Tanacetum cinerariifolium]